MGNIAIGLVVGFVAAVVLFIVWSRMRKSSRKDGPQRINVHGSIEDIRSVGELVVFKIVTKEIVTAADHWFGEWGSKYLTWLASEKKMAMIFEFEINFRYNLRSSDFVIQPQGQGEYRLKMPKCFYDIYIRDISFYDEQNAKLLPWLVPEFLSNVFGTGSTESDKNRLKEEAKRQAGQMAKNFVEKMQSEVQASARQTLEALGKAFGAQRVTIDFSDSQLVQKSVDSAA